MYIKLARFQLENWNAQARLGSEPFQLGLAQAGKFQLEPITRLGMYLLSHKWQCVTTFVSPCTNDLQMIYFSQGYFTQTATECSIVWPLAVWQEQMKKFISLLKAKPNGKKKKKSKQEEML